MQQKILIVDPNRQSLETLREALKRQQYEVITAYTAEEAKTRLLGKVFHLALVDEKIVAKKGQKFMDFLYQTFPGLPALLLHRQAPPLTWQETAEKQGHQLFSRSSGMPRLLQWIGELLRETESLPPDEPPSPFTSSILGESAAMETLRQTLKTVALVSATVLLRGETGTGKEMAARFLHAHSSRRHNRFVAVNCAALTESLLESELFGHEKGAFTGANRQRLGKFEHAGQGTLFLDEIGEISAPLQAKMLRVLDQREFERVGGNKTLKVTCRIIAASNIDFNEAMKNKRFREDLYYRLNVVSIDLPPLRQRKEDIPLLATHFLKQKSAEHKKSVKNIAAQAMHQLTAYPWPGNVRELENTIEQAVIMAQGNCLERLALPETESQETANVPRSFDTGKDLTQMTLKDFIAEILTESEAVYFDRMLQHHRGHISKTAAAAGIDRKTFYRKIDRCGLNPKTYKKTAKK